MNKLLITLIFLFSSFVILAQDEPQQLNDADSRNAVTMITNNYSDWQKVTLSGKLDIDRVSVSPSVKIYMVRNKSIVMSIRVPLLGEVGTINITPERVSLVNKMAKTYCTEDIANLVADLPIGISDLQDLLMGYIFLPDYGTLSINNCNKVQIFTDSDVEGWFIIPKEQPLQYDVTCGYNTLADGRTANIIISTLDGINSALVEYSYQKNKMDMDVDIRARGKDIGFTFKINEINFNGKAVQPATPDNKYRKTSLSEFFKNLL